MQTEEQRLRALRRYEILDSPREVTFDRILTIVTSVLDVPGAAITFVDRDRSWYKAEIGMPYSGTPRSDNMCDSVLRQDGALIINDVNAAPRETVMPLVNAGFRFYVGVPLTTADGIKLGTVCAVDVRPRELTESQSHLLAQLAEIVVDEMELRLAARKLAESDAELRRLNQELETASRNKSSFLASMSHELRTPLNGILGASELLKQGLFGSLSPKQAEYINDIDASGKHLLRLIEDVLDLSRIEAGQTRLDQQTLDVRMLMESCTVVVRGAVEAKSVRLVIEPPEPSFSITADERRTTQVVCNLLSNALKFTPEHGSVLFKAWREGDEAVFLVQDDGPGVPPEFRDRIFEQFFRVNEDREGTGLGLPLAKQLVELQGGRVWLECEPPATGARFYFTLPARAST
jgi:signal transduction histidine kinase